MERVTMHMTLKVADAGTSGIYAITKEVEGALPHAGMRYIFQLPTNDDEGVVWLNGCLMGRVVDVCGVEERGVTTAYTVELETIALTFEQFQEVCATPWLKKLGWKVTETSL